MGGHYGSVQVRTDDRAKVLEVTDQIAASMSIRMLVGPTLKGWVGIYPESNGQDESVGQAFAEQLPGYVMHVLVHDDDIFAYWLHLDGTQIDSYHSMPGYFGEANRATEEAMRGNPKLFEPIAPTAPAKLAKLLDRTDRPTFAVETLMQFGKVLGISNLATAYEYLQNGERDDIKGWRQFVELPAGAVAEVESAKKSHTAHRNRLKKAGVLLAREQRKGFQHGDTNAGDGFLVGWFNPGRTSNLSQFNPPWGKPTAPVLPAASMPLLVTDATGTLLALATDVIEIWNWTGSDWARQSSVPTAAKPHAPQISPSGRQLLCWIDEKLAIFDVAEGVAIKESIELGRPRQTVFHPNDNWLLAIDDAFKLLPLAEGLAPRTLYLGGKAIPPRQPNIAALFARSGGLDMENIRKIQAQTLKQMTRGMSQKDADEMTREVEKNLENVRKTLFERDNEPQPPRSKENVGGVGFSRDGQWLWCNSMGRLRVFAWQDLLSTTDETMPAPRFTFQAVKTETDIHPRYLVGMMFENDSRAVVFGDTYGQLYRMSLDDGSIQLLFELPGQPAVAQLRFSRDGNYLGIGSSTRAADGVNTDKSAWEVYDYTKLCDGNLTESNRFQ